MISEIRENQEAERFFPKSLTCPWQDLFQAESHISTLGLNPPELV